MQFLFVSFSFNLVEYLFLDNANQTVQLLRTSEENLRFSNILLLLDAELKVIRETTAAAVKVVEGCSLNREEGCSKVVKIGIGHPSHPASGRAGPAVRLHSDLTLGYLLLSGC